MHSTSTPLANVGGRAALERGSDCQPQESGSLSLSNANTGADSGGWIRMDLSIRTPSPSGWRRLIRLAGHLDGGSAPFPGAERRDGTSGVPRSGKLKEGFAGEGTHPGDGGSIMLPLPWSMPRAGNATTAAFAAPFQTIRMSLRDGFSLVTGAAPVAGAVRALTEKSPSCCPQATDPARGPACIYR